MSVTTQLNNSQQLENGIRLALIAQGTGMTADDVFYNCFQPATDSIEAAPAPREFPQVLIIAGPDIPLGFKDTTRKVSVSIDVWTYQAKSDDPARQTLATIYGKVRAMIDTANTTPSTWLSAYLPSGWQFGGFMIVESGMPYYDGNFAGMPIMIEAQICVP
jgi:hypothetical protein